jgi:hypothetical protein
VADRRREVVVIGGGVGGLAAAIRLRVRGHAVTVYERNAELGGKLAVLQRDGFTFDIGPSLVTLPHVYDELFRLAGTTLADEVDLVRLDPQFRYWWRTGRHVEVRDDGCDEPGFDEFVARGRTIWEVSERTFFAGPMSSPLSLAKRLRRPRDLTDIDPLRTLHRGAVEVFGDDGRAVDETLLTQIRHYGAGERALRPAIVRSAGLRDAECDKQWELPFSVASADDWSEDERVAWVRALGVDERLTVVAAAAVPPLRNGEHFANVNGLKAERQPVLLLEKMAELHG